MGGKRKRRAAPQASRQDAPLTPENATETREEVEAGPQDTGNEPERAQGPSQRSGDEEPSRIEITMHSHADWDRPPTYVGCFIPGAEVRIGMPPLVTREEALTAAGCPRPGEPEGYCGPPLLASCPHKRHQTHETGELERLFTMTGIHEYRCLVCSERFFVWACCGHVSTEPPLPSSVYRDPAFACCPACGENRFAATSR
jgi:hypothetical protein